jgi:hypothetical protein
MKNFLTLKSFAGYVLLAAAAVCAYIPAVPHQVSLALGGIGAGLLHSAEKPTLPLLLVGVGVLFMGACANTPYEYCADQFCVDQNTPVCGGGDSVAYAQYCDVTQSFGPCQRSDGSAVVGCKIPVNTSVGASWQGCIAVCP